MKGLAVMADVVVRRADPNLKLGVARHMETLTCTGGEPFARTWQLVFAAARYALHDFRGDRSKYQSGRQDNTDRFFASIGHGQAVTDTFAIKVNAGLGGNSDAF